MELYTLDSNFAALDVIDKYHTAIWSERYSASGDFQITLPHTKANLARLPIGRFMAEADSDEVGIIETQETLKGVLTVSGYFLTGFLRNRIIRKSRDHDAKVWDFPTSTPGSVCGQIVQGMCISGGVGINAGSSSPVLGAGLEAIANLTVAANAAGTVTAIAVPFGPVYDAIKAICDSNELGFKLWLSSSGGGSYALSFKTYAGRDLTRAQTTNPVVSFNSALDLLVDTKEIRSIAGYKTAAYAYAPSADPLTIGSTYFVGTAYAPGTTSYSNFERRTMMVLCDDITVDDVGNDPTKLQTMLNQRAKDALANNNYVRMLDGQIVPQKAFVYGVDYLLGDVIELQSDTGIVQNARVTEFIRSSDEKGELAYPTISVLSTEA